MHSKYLKSCFLLALFFAAAANAGLSEDDFVVKTTRQLLNLCTASAQDVHYREAIHFCQGYLVGAYQYYQAETADKQDRMVCFPEPKPSRNEAIGMFVSWAQKHPEYMNETPVETEFRFLTEKWPCKK